jgi:hypothetical protein
MIAILTNGSFACPQLFTNVSLATKGVSSSQTEREQKSCEMVADGTTVKAV